MVDFSLKSPAFEHMGDIPQKYTCQGENINPPLLISNVPEKTESLILIMEDPDAPGITVTHWIICHLEPSTNEISEGEHIKNAIIGKNMMGKNEYMGPCPPFGKHRYFFKLYALNKKLDINDKTRKKQLLKASKGHIIEQTELIGLYKKIKT
jgi:Raf kinase inhibitor-like YbhB/YbcL family protein